MIAAGDLRYRITLERLQEVNGVEDWLPIANDSNPYAAIEWLGGDGRARVRIRWRSDLTTLRDCEPAMRVTWTNPAGNAHVFDIEDVVAPDLTEVHLFCKDVVIDAPALATGGKRIKGG